MNPAEVKFCWCGLVSPCSKHKGSPKPKPAAISKKKSSELEPQPELFDFENV